MRIPKYESKGGISAPQVRASRVADPIDLGQAINFVENRYEQGIKEQERGQKLFYNNETSRVGLELERKFAESQAAIAEGNYGAEKEYQKFYDKTISDSLGRLTDFPPELRDTARNDYERFGLKSGLQLKSAVRSKMKADTIANFSAREKMLDIQLSNATTEAETSAILGEYSDLVAKSGVFNDTEAKLKIAGMFDQSLNYRMENDPQGLLSDMEKNPKRYEGVREVSKVIDFAKNKVVQIENQNMADQYIADFEKNTGQALRAAEGELTLDDMEDADSPVIKALRSTNTKPAKIDKVTNVLAIGKFGSRLDGLSNLVATTDDPREAIKALDQFQFDVLSSINTELKPTQAVQLTKASKRLFYNRTPSGKVTEFQMSIDTDAPWKIAPGVQAPNALAAEYLEETMPKDLVGADKVRYKLDFMDTFELELGDYSPSWLASEDEKIIKGAINRAKESMAIKRNPSLLGVEGSTNRIIGNGKDEAVSGESTAEAGRGIATPDFTIRTGADGKSYKVYEDGTYELNGQ